MRDTFYWTGTQYDKRTTDKLKGIIEEAFEGKISRTELTQRLSEEFNGVLSASKPYFEGVADHIISQSQNVSRVNQALKYGVEHFQVKARLDERTSDICRSMHGRIIEAAHLERQVNNILDAKSIDEKKRAATWSDKPQFGKLPSNFGLPPYHFRCRTEVVPVWLSEEEVDGKKVRFTSKRKDDVFVHIDKTGVERRAKETLWTHSKSLKPTKKRTIALLNSIEEIAPHLKDKRRFAALSDNSVIIFQSDEIYTIVTLENKKRARDYFKRNSFIERKEIIKWPNRNILLRPRKGTGLFF